MEPVIYKFRGAVVGGFNRQDVMDYVEKTARENSEKIEALTRQLEEAVKEKEALRETLESLRSQSGDLADQEAKVRASLEESTRTLTHVRGDLQTTQSQLMVAKKELTGLQAKVSQLEPLAQRYEALKDRVATVELDAHRKAQTTVDEAQTQAERIKAQTDGWLSQVAESYESIRNEVYACARRAEESRAAFEAMEETYRELFRRES